MVYFLDDPAPALWLRDSLDADGRTVAGFVPTGYEFYVRILNPVVVERLDGPEERLRWSTAAASVGAPVYPWMQWDETVVAADGHLPVRWAQPDMGDLDPTVATALAEVLAEHTQTPDDCYFATWEGYGDPAAREDSLVALPPDRGMRIYAGTVLTGAQGVGQGLSDRRPLRWWPEDHAWCVGQDIYARSVLVGASAACIKALFAHPDLDVHSVRITDAVLPEDF